MGNVQSFLQRVQNQLTHWFVNLVPAAQLRNSKAAGVCEGEWTELQDV